MALDTAVVNGVRHRLMWRLNVQRHHQMCCTCGWVAQRPYALRGNAILEGEMHVQGVVKAMLKAEKKAEAERLKAEQKARRERAVQRNKRNVERALARRARRKARFAERMMR